MIIYDQINDINIQVDALEYARNTRSQENSRAIQTYLNPSFQNQERYLNQKIFNKQIFDLSARKIFFQSTNYLTDYYSKKIFLTILDEKEKSNPMFDDLGRRRSQAVVEAVVQPNEPNYYFSYRKDFVSTLNLCSPRS